MKNKTTYPASYEECFAEALRKSTAWPKRQITQKAANELKDAVTIELPVYKGHKEVWALQIDDIKYKYHGVMITPKEKGYTPFLVSYDYAQKHEPQIGGYFVRYKDGHESFSSAKAFEEGYMRKWNYQHNLDLTIRDLVITRGIAKDCGRERDWCLEVLRTIYAERGEDPEVDCRIAALCDDIL